MDAPLVVPAADITKDRYKDFTRATPWEELVGEVEVS
jgi:hypothetical protein